jgi:hypothetical protein
MREAAGMTGFAEFISGVRGEVHPLQRAAWADDAPDREPADPDDRAAMLLGGGYRPGETFERGLRYDDLEGQLAAAREELTRAEGVEAHAARLRERGQIDVFAWSDVAARADDSREAVARLDRELRDRDRSRIEAAEAVQRAQQQVTDPVTLAGQDASRMLAEVTAAQAHEQLAARARAQAAAAGVPFRRWRRGR